MATSTAHGINNGRKMAREFVTSGAEDPWIVGFAELGVRKIAACAGLGERVRHEPNTDLYACGREVDACREVEKELPRIQVLQAVDLAICCMRLPLRKSLCPA